MTDDRPALRTCELIGKPAYDRSGGYLGRVADLVVVADGEGRPRLTEIVVARRPWGRLFGYERQAENGPWLLVRLARWVMRRDVRKVRWTEVRVGHDDPYGS